MCLQEISIFTSQVIKKLMSSFYQRMYKIVGPFPQDSGDAVGNGPC